MAQHLTALQQNEHFKNSLMNIWGNLSDKQRKELNDIANPTK